MRTFVLLALVCVVVSVAYAQYELTPDEEAQLIAEAADGKCLDGRESKR